MIRLAVSVYAAMIRDRMHFAQASYRDGEWSCILGGYKGYTTNHQDTFVPELRAAMIRTLMEPTGQWCNLWLPVTAGKDVRRRALDWIDENKPPVTWIADRVDALANVGGHARPLFAAMRTRRTILVGPMHLNNLPADLLKPYCVIPVPEHDAWRKAARIADDVGAVAQPGDLVLFSAGLASNLVIHRLRGERNDLTLWDIGSTLDPYCGVYSRKIYQIEAWRRDIIPRNLR